MSTSWVRRVSAIVAVLLMSAAVAHAEGTQLLVSNVRTQQRPFTAIWDVTYDLETVGDMAVTVSLYLSMDSGATYPILCATVSGDVGADVLPDPGLWPRKHIVWNAGADFPGLSSATCRLRVTADDGLSGIPEGFVTVLSGTFMMGSPTSEPLRQTNETQHQVTLSHGIYAQTTEVTNQQYRDMAQWAYDNGYVTTDGSYLYDKLDGSTELLKRLGDGYGIAFGAGVFSCINPTHPVQYLTWYGSVAYCDWLSLQQGLPRAYSHSTWQCNGGNPYTAPGYRLPTEAEWEYACRGGAQTPFSTGSCLDAGSEANYCGSEPYTGCPTGPCIHGTVPVGSYPANAFGLYDMHGNLWEWCNDWPEAYGGTVTDPVGAGAGYTRVIRGGVWGNYARYCRSAYRYEYDPADSGANGKIGFRPVRSADSAVPQTGTIVINREPNSINAPWQITGPGGFSQSGAGDLTLTNRAVGSYTLTWGAVAGWTTPSPAAVTQTLFMGGLVTFTGLYVENTVVPDGFVAIPAGTFMMGSPTTEPGRWDGETEHQVTLTHGIYVQTTEVTNQQYRDMAQWAYNNGYVTATTSGLYDVLDGSTELLKTLGAGDYEITFSDGEFSCINPDHPVKYVTWYGAAAYCDWLSLQQGLPRAYNHSTWKCNAGNPYTASGYRLPTEAEWEYACRAGSTTAFANGPITNVECGDQNLEQIGWYCGNAGSRTHTVAQKLPNVWGLYDMHGHLFEWCNDWSGLYDETVTDPVGTELGSSRVVRGGYLALGARYCRSAFRGHASAPVPGENIGLRTVMTGF